MSIDHRAEAESRLLMAWEEDRTPENVAHLVAEAQVHATLARDEDQAVRTADMRDALRLLRGREYDVRKLVSTHIAKALASREPNRWKAGLELAKALDMADCNMDDAIDARLSDDGWDPRSAYKAPASAVPADDPWATKPNITSEIPERVRRVIVERLADMLLSREDDGWHAEQARRFAFALKNEGADLTGDIEKRITDLTLGRDPSDPPF
ncbi:MAG: hypothetical protein HOY79_00990 [Streptomyces sp.]|nr:hypothetical protein [Streptomyces sp.]